MGRSGPEGSCSAGRRPQWCRHCARSSGSAARRCQRWLSVDGQPLHICRYAERVGIGGGGAGGRRTGVELGEGPLAADKATVSLLLLLLAQGEVDFVLAGGDAFAGKLELLPVAVTLVLAVHEDEGGEAWGDVAFRLHVHAERQGEIGDGDEALDVPITVPRSVLLQPRAAAPELDGAGYLFEGRHVGEARSRSENEQAATAQAAAQ